MYNLAIAYILWLFSGCGALGFHRFYLGKIPTGILWMFTGGLGMIGSVYDFFTLPSQVREANFRKALYDQTAGTHRPLGQPDPPHGSNWRYANDAQFSMVKKKGHEKEKPERAILKIAKENKGILTVSDVVLEANVTIDEAKKMLDTLVTKGIAEMRVRKSGSLVYVITDMADKDEPLEDI